MASNCLGSQQVECFRNYMPFVKAFETWEALGGEDSFGKTKPRLFEMNRHILMSHCWRINKNV